jgi:hypothetical protein
MITKNEKTPEFTVPPPGQKGHWIVCHRCGGHGVVSKYSAGDFEGPEECKCNGGQLWRYPSGRLAVYPGGPFAGTSQESL